MLGLSVLSVQDRNKQGLLCNLSGLGLRSLTGSSNVSREGLPDNSRVATSRSGSDEGVGRERLDQLLQNNRMVLWVEGRRRRAALNRGYDLERREVARGGGSLAEDVQDRRHVNKLGLG